MEQNNLNSGATAFGNVQKTVYNKAKCAMTLRSWKFMIKYFD